MKTQYRRLVYGGAIALFFVCLNGCATLHDGGGQVHVNDALKIYAPFDNSRGWGPSYLIGPPGHHFGEGGRIDDARNAAPDQ